MKICKDCQAELPLSEFSVSRRETGKLRISCRCGPCSREYSRAIVAKRREDPKAKEADAEKLRQWRAANKERYRRQYLERNKRSYWADPDSQRKRRRELRREKGEEFRAKHLEYENRRRARLLGSDSPGVSAAEWDAIKDACGNRCVYCYSSDRKLTRDHVVPLSRGGKDEPRNVVPACQSCNSRKNRRLILEWAIADAEEFAA